MIHLLFLLASLGLVALGQKLALLALPRLKGWAVRRCLQLLALAMPMSVLILFSLTMLPTTLTPQAAHFSDSLAHREWLLALVGLGIVITPVVISLGLSIVRLAWLYGRALRHTWEAPSGLEKLLETSKGRKLQIRLWYSNRSFAFNLPGLRPGAKALVILSSEMVGQLTETELQAVLWHEAAHLARRDFWVIWLAEWWRNAFFYLPLGWQFFQLLKDEQELACDDRVARSGGRGLMLALADALLKVWEETSTRRADHLSAKKVPEPGFNVAELASPEQVTLTEQRVNRLIEFVADPAAIELRGCSWLKTGGLLSGSVGLWLVGLELMHLIMLPLGCAIALGVV